VPFKWFQTLEVALEGLVILLSALHMVSNLEAALDGLLEAAYQIHPGCLISRNVFHLLENTIFDSRRDKALPCL